jgi:hypothetical protein
MSHSLDCLDPIPFFSAGKLVTGVMSSLASRLPCCLFVSRSLVSGWFCVAFFAVCFPDDDGNGDVGL